MKGIIVIGDGMADYPLPELGGRTPLMAAETPAMDQIAREGRVGLLRTLEWDLPTGSAVANLSIMGYNPRDTFQGRGVLEAASLGVSLSKTDMAARINLICVEDDHIRSHSAGHISNEAAETLIRDLGGHFRDLNIKLVPGLSYRHVLVVPDGDARLKCAPPHDHVGQNARDLLVQPLVPQAKPTADLLNHLILESQAFLGEHPVNRRRKSDGHQPANSLWPWSPGVKPQMDTFQQRFGLHGAVITAVDLIKGLGIYAGLDVIPVAGATGLYDTNYEGKADACLQALENHDFVYLHVEAPDEAGHEQNVELKVRCIQDLDQRLLQRILDGLEQRKTEAVIAVLPDHPTPIATGTHTRDPVPVAIRDPRRMPDLVKQFDEENVKGGDLGLLSGAEFIELVVGKR
jgi:2,3-bisphosphoglycerate-independent phosphoglycerate mutase